jgi:hypothetical protein
MGDAYFESLYSKRDGYVKPQDFWEAPEWAARVAHFVADADFYVARNLNEAKLFLKQAAYDNVVMSVMEDNKYYAEKILDGYKGKVVAGGYINPDFFKSMKNVTWMKNLEGLAKQLGVPFKNGSDYRFFKGMQTIPRLELSRGCLHKCAFCDIPKKIEMATDEMIDSQIEGFKKMKYSLVYLNDKTFGQAKNYERLADIYQRLKKSNKDFEGFIVQTTAAQYLKMDEQFLKRSGIKYVELGVETYNDKFLKSLNKPHNTALIDKAAEKIRKLKMNFIPNVMVGLAGREGIDPKDMDQAYRAQEEENVWLRGSNRGKLALDPKAKRGAFYFTKDPWYAKEYGDRVDAYVVNVKRTWNPKDPSTMDEDIKAAMRKHSEFPGETGTAGPYVMHGDEMIPMGPTEAEQYGDWAVLEDKKIQKMLKERGYDSYMTSEGGGSIAVFGKKNISEYKPNIWNETAATYKNTLDFLKKNRDIVSHVNVYSLATHEGTELQGELQSSEQDTDENILAKSWLKHPKVHEKFYQDVVNYGAEQLDKGTAPTVTDTDKTQTISDIKPLEDIETELSLDDELKKYDGILDGVKVDAIGEEGSTLPEGFIQVTVIDKNSPAYGGSFSLDLSGDLQAQLNDRVKLRIEMQSDLTKGLAKPAPKFDIEPVVEGGRQSQSFRYAYYGIFDIAKAAKGMKNVRSYLAKQKTLNGLPVTPELVKTIGNVADSFYKDRKKANAHKRVVAMREGIASGAINPTLPETVEKMKDMGGVAPYSIRHTGDNFFIGQKMRYGKFKKEVSLFDTDNDIVRRTEVKFVNPVTGIEEKLAKSYDKDGNRLIEGPIFSTDRETRLDEMEKILKKNKHYSDWYERWRKFMFQFADKDLDETKIKRIAAISGILGSGKSPQTQQTIWAEAINQLDTGRRPTKIAKSDLQKVMDIWEGKEDEILGRTDDDGIKLIQERFGRKIGPYLAASIDPSSPNVLVLDRHMPKGWGYNVLATADSPQGGWNMHPSVEKEVRDDILELAKRTGTSVAGVQAALWFDMRTPATDQSDIVKIAQIEPGRYVPYVMHKRSFPEVTTGIHYSAKSLEEGEFIYGADPSIGISPRQYSNKDIGERIKRSTKNWPYVPAVYMYQPGVRVEPMVKAKGINRYSFKYDPRRIYDGNKDPYDYWGTAREELKKDPGASLTNIFLNLVKSRQGYDGVVVKSPYRDTEQWMMVFEKAEVIDPSKVASIGISDVVEGIEKSYDSVEDAVEDMRVRGFFFNNYLKTLKTGDRYTELSFKRYGPSLSRFEGATSGEIEIGIGLQMNGPLAAQRAFVGEVAISRSQRYAYVVHSEMKDINYPVWVNLSPGKKFTFRAKRKYDMREDGTPRIDELARDLEAAGLKEFNVIHSPGGFALIEQFVWDDKNAEQMADIMEKFAEPGDFVNQVQDVHSEIMGDDDPDVAMESHSKAIIEYWGEKKGKEIINERIKEREEYRRQLSEGTYQEGLAKSKAKFRKERGVGSFVDDGTGRKVYVPKQDIETEEIISGGHGVIKVTKAEHDFASRFRLGVSHINSFAIDAYRIATGRPSETIGVYETLDELGPGWREELIDELGWSQSEADDLIDAVIYSANEVIRHNKTTVKQDIDTETKDVLDRIGRRDVTITEKIREKANYKKGTATTAIADKLHPLKMFAGAKSKAYMMHRGLPGVQSSINAMMEHGKLHLDPSGVLTTGTKGEGFIPWLRELGPDAEKFFYWLIAKRDQVRSAKDKKYIPMFGDEERSKLLGWTGTGTSKGKKWGAVNAEFQAFNNSVLKIGVDSGLLDPAMVAQFKDQFYIPFYRIFEDEQATAEFIKAPVNTKRIIAAQIKKLKGSKRNIGDPLENILANWAHLIKQSMANQARKEAFNSINGSRVLSENGEPAVEEVPWKDTVIFKSGKDGKTTFVYEKQGIEVLGFKDGGKTKFFKVNDPELFQAIALQNNLRLPGWLAAILGAPKALLTFGATITPSFVVANTTRDTLHTYTISKGFVPFISTIKGFYKTLRKDQDFVEYMASGNAFVGSYVKADRPDQFAKYTKKILKREGRGAVGRILNTPAKLWGFWETFTEASENATRLALYSDLKKTGSTKLEASFAARDIMDFQKKGASPVVQYLTATVPFLNARIQGLYRMGDAMVENPKMYALKGASVALASIGLWAAFKDDERYKELEEWEKFAYYHFWIGDKHFRIPKPFETGVIWSSAWTAAADVLTGNEEVKHITGFISASILDTFAFNPVPQAARPILEQYFNKNFFTGRAIEPEAFKFRKPEDRFYPWDSESAQVIGKVLGVSPRRVQSLIRGYLAGLGLGIMAGADIIARQFGDFPVRPSMKIDQYPMIGRFVKATPSNYSKYQTEFYNIFNELNELTQTINIAQRDGEFKTAAEMRKTNSKKLVAFARAKFVKRNLARIRKDVHGVWKNNRMSPENKLKRLDQLTLERKKYVKEFYDWYLDNK